MLLLATPQAQHADFADTQILRTPRAVPFPDTDRLERARKARQRIEQCEDARRVAARVAAEQATSAARKNAHLAGYQAGYRAGTHWGLFCGAVAGGLVTTAVCIFAVIGRAWWLTL